MRFTQPLHDGWTLAVDAAGKTPDLPPQASALAGATFAAAVPGSTHTDLLAAGIITDPLIETNEKDVAWVARADWRYDSKFLWAGPAAERVELVFEGLDTVADIELDGVPVGSTRNMHRSYRFDITDTLSDSGNALAVRFTSAYTEAERWKKTLGDRPNAYPEPFNFIRKMACSFGWDWGPTLASAGMWRPVRLEGWSTARIVTVRPLTGLDGDTGILTAHIDLERSTPGADVPLMIDLDLGDGGTTRAEIPAGVDSATIDFAVPHVRRWYPRGYGSPELYDLTVTVSRADNGATLDTWQRRIGFRSVEIDRSLDETGSQFVFVINGERIFAKGVNWIPDDVFPGHMTAERYRSRLQDAVDANVNLVRVWGGGIYEEHAFYDACDELGLLTWQDFLFACAAYPEETPFFDEVEAEARENVARLSSHPSLVIWTGNNENLWMHQEKNWAEEPGGKLSWGEKFYLTLLPRIVAEVDPSRPYTAGSPWSGDRDIEPNHVDHQTFHSWDVWNERDYLHYLDSTPRFVSEFGWQAPATWATLTEAISDEPLAPESPGMLHHQKAFSGPEKMARGLSHHFDVPSGFDDWHFLAQLNQVRALEVGIDHWRSHWPHTAGTIVWQLNDIWPAVSWSMIDSAGRRKPSYFALNDVYAPRRLAWRRTEGTPALIAMNDEQALWSGPVTVRVVRNDGEILKSHTVDIAVEPHSSTVAVLPASITITDPTREFLVADADGQRAVFFGVEDKDFHFVIPVLTVAAVATESGLTVSVTSDGIARDLLVQADRMHPSAHSDRGFVTLLAGETARYDIRSEVLLDPALLDEAYVITELASVIADRLRSSPLELT
ncbi:glycoside hydrolase family 2 protein [Salinibacterium sp. SWN1162]|uniref:glycoside hydrolase family 2 protein n=1 Tax=Salinibacterium sp. SWN1162 TaxID=2792053 RepID=UPI0018CDB187|nr:glycoside hydrolase family 2 protein [Salinibacterium sp. SWN1162]MBH0008393.1 glycoside hydrolase family 2 protein [Salinibacterium sp. SWN1162]